jgi:hypothetical protein
MKIEKLNLIALLCTILAIACSGCLPGSYYGGKNRFGDRWEAVVEEDAPSETLFSRFYYLKQLSMEDRNEEYQKALKRLKNQPDVFWHLEAVYLAILTGHTQKGTELTSALKEEVGKQEYEDDFELKGVVGLLELLLKQKNEITFLQKALQEEKEKSDKLAHQLKELKNIEKIIHERETKKENE